MATLEDLVSAIQRIQGVKGYVVVRQDGQVLSHNVPNVEGLSALIFLCGTNANTVKTEMGASLFKHLTIVRSSNEKILVFPMNGFWLGLVQLQDAYTPDIVGKVQAAIHGLNGR